MPGRVADQAARRTRTGKVVLRDGVAYLGGSAGTTIVNVADPAQPRITGTIPWVGGFSAIGTPHPLLGGPRAKSLRDDGRDPPLKSAEPDST